MAPKKTTGGSAFDIFLGLNNIFHDFMAQLAESKIEEDVAYVDVNILKAIYDASTTALNQLELDPKFKAYYDQFKIWASAPTKVIDAFPAVGDIVVMPASALSDLQDPILNNMANLVHSAAYDSVKTTGKLKSCQISSFKPDDAVAIDKYCSGAKPGGIIVQQVPVKKLNIGGKTWIQHYPSLIQQKLGLHSVMPSFQTSGDEIAAAIEYHDSYLNHLGSANRLRGVKERLELLGFECNIGGIANGQYQKHKDIYCNTTDISPNTIRDLAVFFSLLLDADINIPEDPDSYKVVRDKAWEEAKARVAQYGDDTWESPNYHKPDWHKLYNEWKEEEQYTKNILYNQVRELLVLRDIHHMIEEKYQIDAGAHSMEGMKLILANAKKMQAIISKNGWGNIQSNIDQVASLVKSGKAVSISGVSDAIGHVAHSIVTDKLSKAKQYGGCSMSGNVSNISAGNLAYCEGILQGEHGTVIGASAGNSWNHKIVPTTLTVSVDEEDYASNEYAFKITLPEDEALKKGLNEYLMALGFNCSSKQCKVATKSLDEIRQMALFLSNLRGVDSKVGEHCAQKAIDAAASVAIEQNKKGIFSFTQQPIHNNTKEWVDMCFKQHGIMPPGMTEEEASILKLIGANKVYGGCSFEQSDILPNLGFIKYCEGVRKNKSATINAYMQHDGSLSHLFHGESAAHDQIAIVNITPVDSGTKSIPNYEVSLSAIDLRDKKPGKPLQKQVIKRLESIGLTCPSPTQCSTAAAPLDESTLRRMASYLSSLHQAYNVDESCIKAAENYAWQQAISLPPNINAHESKVYPFELNEWNTEVCSKIGKPKEAVKAPPSEAKVAEAAPILGKKFALYEMQQAIGKTKKWGQIGGCINKTATKPTIAVGKFCYGIQGNYKNEDKGEIQKIVTAERQPKVNYLHIEGVKKPVVFTSQGYDLYMTLPDELLDPLLINALTHQLNWQQNGNTFKSQYNVFKGAKFMSYMHNFVNIPQECKEAAIANAVKNAKEQTYDVVVEPYDMKGWDKFCNVAAGKLPPLSKEQIDAVVVLVNALDYDAQDIWDALKKLPGAEKYMPSCFKEKTGALNQSILCKQWIAQHPETPLSPHELAYLWQQCLFEYQPEWFQPPKPLQKKKMMSDLTAASIASIQQDICELKDDGGTLENVLDWFANSFPNVEFGAITKGVISEMYESCPSKLKKFEASSQIMDFVKSYMSKYINVVFSGPALITDVAAAMKAEGYDPPGIAIINKAIKSLEAMGDIEKTVSEGKPTVYWMPAPTPGIQTLIDETAKELGALIAKIDPAVMNSAKNVTQYKKLPKAVKDYLHHYFNLILLVAHKEGKSYDEVVKTAQEYLIKEAGFKLTPLMIKLQLDIEKNKKVCEGKLPAEGEITKEESCKIGDTAVKAEAKGTPFGDLSQSAQDSIAIKVIDWIGEGASASEAEAKIEKEWPDIIIDKYLTTLIFNTTMKMHEAKEAMEKGDEWIPYLDSYVPKDVLNPTVDNIQSMQKQGLSMPNIVQNCYTGWWTKNIKPQLFKNWVKEVLAMTAPKKVELDTEAKVKHATDAVLEIMANEPSKKFNINSVAEVWNKNLDKYGYLPNINVVQEALNILVETNELKKDEEGYYYIKGTTGQASIDTLKYAAMKILGEAPSHQMSYPDIYEELSKGWTFSFKDTDLSEALNDLVEEGKLKDVGEEDYGLAEEVKEKTVADIDKLKVYILNFIAEAPEQILGAYALEEKLDNIFTYEKGAIMKAISQLSSEDKIIWAGPNALGLQKPVISDFLENEPEYEEDLQDTILILDKSGMDPANIANEIAVKYQIKYTDDLIPYIEEVIAANPPTVKSWIDLSDEEKLEFAKDVVVDNITGWDELKDLLEANNVEPDENVIPSIKEFHGMWEHHLAELPSPDMAATKAVALNIINNAPYDYDWDIGSIAGEFPDHGYVDPGDDILSIALGELIGQGLITADSPDGPWHSKMTIKEIDGVNTLVPIEEPAVISDPEDAIVYILSQWPSSWMDFGDIWNAWESKSSQLGTPLSPVTLKGTLQMLAAEGKIFWDKDSNTYKYKEQEVAKDDIDIWVANSPDETVKELIDYIKSSSSVKSAGVLADEVSEKYKIINNHELVNYIYDIATSKEDEEEFFEPMTYEKMADSTHELIDDKVITLAKKGMPPDEIIANVTELYHFAVSDQFKKLVTQAWQEYGGEEEEKEGSWYFQTSSEEYGMEVFGPYESEEAAESSKQQVKENAAKLKDGIKRQYSDVYYSTAPLSEHELHDVYSWEEEEGEEEEKFVYEGLPDSLKELVDDDIADLAKQGVSLETIVYTVALKHNLAMTGGLTSAAEEIWQLYAKEEELPPGDINAFLAFDPDHKKILNEYIENAPDGTSVGTLAEAISDKFHIINNEDLVNYVFAKVMGYQGIEEEPAPMNFADLDYDTKVNIENEIMFLAKQEPPPSKETMIKHMAHKYNLVEDDVLVQEVSFIMKAYEPKEPPEVVPVVVEESMITFIKAGMSAKAVAQLYAGQIGDKQAAKVAEKLYKIHHPDQEVMVLSFADLPKWTQEIIKARAQAMLNKGKTQEDTAWWIAYNYHITKEGARHIVNTLAKIPVSKTEELLKAFKTLGIGEELGGCTVGKGGLENLKGQTVSYCQGVTAPVGKKPDSKIYDGGETLSHTTGTQHIVVDTDTQDITWETKIIRHEPNLPVSISNHVARILEGWGFKCEEGQYTLNCTLRGSDGHTMSIEDQDTLRKAALFLSAIDSVPKLPGSCIPHAVDYAQNHAIGINKTSKPWTVPVYPDTVEDWDKTVCSKVGAK